MEIRRLNTFDPDIAGKLLNDMEYHDQKFIDRFAEFLNSSDGAKRQNVSEKVADTQAPGGKLRWYFATLTISSENTIHELLDGFQKLMCSKMVDIISYTRCIEFHKDGRPHMHIYYSSRKNLDRKKFSNLYKYGRVDFQFVKNHIAIVKYITKEINNKKLISYLKEYETTVIETNIPEHKHFIKNA